MVLRALEALHNLFSDGTPLFKVTSPSLCRCALVLCALVSAYKLGLPPYVFVQLKLSLQSGELVVQPPLKEASKLLASYVKNVAESTR